MKKKAKKFFVVACFGGIGYGIVKLLQLESVKDMLFAALGEDRYLKIEGVTRTATDVLQWPVHFVKALLP